MKFKDLKLPSKHFKPYKHFKHFKLFKRFKLLNFSSIKIIFKFLCNSKINIFV